MEGGEYLSAERLQRLWEQLDEWVREAGYGRRRPGRVAASPCATLAAGGAGLLPSGREQER